LSGKQGTGNHDILTVHDDPSVLDKTIHNFERLCSGCPSLILSEPVQPTQDSFYLILSKNFLYEFLCAALSQSTHGREGGSLNFPCVTCLVARARVERISTIIFTTMSLMVGVNVIVV
jgi:hypothetical protein